MPGSSPGGGNEAAAGGDNEGPGQAIAGFALAEEEVTKEDTEDDAGLAEAQHIAGRRRHQDPEYEQIGERTGDAREEQLPRVGA